jgi:hypothetical protein
MSAVLPVMNGGSHAHSRNPSSDSLMSGDCHQGPELLLRSVNLSSTSLSNLSERFQSFGSNGNNALRSSRHEVKKSASDFRSPSPLKRSQPMGYCIPLSDVVVADVHDDHLLFLTTQKQGFFEFSFDSKNAFDLMTAFLGAWLPEERITRMKNESTSATTFLDPICSFDVEAFTNTRIQEKVKHETLSEKMRRKVVHIAFQMGESEYNSLDYLYALDSCTCFSDIVLPVNSYIAFLLLLFSV